MITGKHIETGENLQQFIEHECQKIVQKYIGAEPIDMNITVEKDTQNNFLIEGHIHIGKKQSVHCHGTDADAYRAATQLVNNLETRIKKYTTRLRDLKRKVSDDKVLSAGYFVIDANQTDEGKDTPLIIAESTKAVETLTVSDAVMKMDLLNQNAILFKNASHGYINAVYRRADGHIGWIDPTQTLG